MPRPPAPPDREDVPPDERDDYDVIAERVVGKFGGWTPYHGTLANSPSFGAALNALGRLARTAATVRARTRTPTGSSSTRCCRQTSARTPS